MNKMQPVLITGWPTVKAPRIAKIAIKVGSGVSMKVICKTYLK